MSWIGGALSLIGTGLQGLFGFKSKQADVIVKAMDVVSDVNKSDDARAVAAAQIISNEARSESWLTRIWRPLVVLTFTGFLIAHLLGYTPINLSDDILMRIFDIVEYSILGYMGMRSADKWIRDLSLGSVLKKFIEKKLS